MEVIDVLPGTVTPLDAATLTIISGGQTGADRAAIDWANDRVTGGTESLRQKLVTKNLTCATSMRILWLYRNCDNAIINHHQI